MFNTKTTYNYYEKLVNPYLTGSHDAAETLLTFWTNQAKDYGSYPPYNLTKNEDSSKFLLTLAVAGFGPEDLEVLVEENQLHIKGKAHPKSLPEGHTFVHKGIAERLFTRTFSLGEYVEVKNVVHKHGMLSIELEMVVPESKKPKKIEIKAE